MARAVLLGRRGSIAPAPVDDAPFDFATMFSKGAFNVDDITPVADGTAISPWEDASALALDLEFDPVYGGGTKPVYKVNIAGGGTKPVLRATTPNLLQRTLVTPIPQPFTILWVGRTGADSYIVVNNAARVLWLPPGSADYLRMYAGNNSGGACADLSVGFHYILAIFDGASSVLRVDGTNVTFDAGSPGTGALSSQTFLPGSHSNGGDPDLRAYGVAPIHPSAGQITDIETFAASLL